MKLSNEEFRSRVRWKQIAMVFQGTMNSLNPVLKVGLQVAEPLVVNGIAKSAAEAKARQLLHQVAYLKRPPPDIPMNGAVA